MELGARRTSGRGAGKWVALTISVCAERPRTGSELRDRLSPGWFPLPTTCGRCVGVGAPGQQLQSIAAHGEKHWFSGPVRGHEGERVRLRMFRNHSSSRLGALLPASPVLSARRCTAYSSARRATRKTSPSSGVAWQAPAHPRREASVQSTDSARGGACRKTCNGKVAAQSTGEGARTGSCEHEQALGQRVPN